LDIEEPILVPLPADATGRARDAELVAAILRKDRKATGEFVARYADAVYVYVRSRLFPQMDPVEDLVQEVFLAAWENLGTYRGSSSLQTWLLGIARHKVESYYRALLRQADPLADENRETTEGAVQADFDERLDRERLRAKTLRVLANLPEAYRLALLWRYWEKQPAREMAARTGKTEKAIERLLARARNLFRQRWHYD